MSEEYALPAKRIDVHNHLCEDPEGTKLVGLMDQSGIETTLIMGVRTDLPLESSNENILQAVRRFPDRLVGGVFADPREPGAIEEVRRYHGEGFRVVKLFPNVGYYPDDDSLLPFFEKVAELGMAVLSHCGWLWSPGTISAAYYSHPGRFEKVIRRFPEMPFIMAHMGGIAGFLETVMLTTRTPNTYADVSPGQGILVIERGGPIVGAIPPEKLLFGADSYDQLSVMKQSHAGLTKLGFGPQAPS